ncbi:unnamed protein product, partial [Rotaria sordida]
MIKKKNFKILCLSILSGLSSIKDFSFLAELDSTVAIAIRVFRRKNTLQLLIFLSIAFQLQTIGEFSLAENLRDKGDLINSTVLFTLQGQICSLFPGYCSYATDVLTSFKLIAKGIDTSLTEQADLILRLLVDLRNLISKTDNETDRQEIGKYAKNYLSFLFYLYTTEKWNLSRDPIRQSVYQKNKTTYLLDIFLTLITYLDEKRLELLEDKLKQLLTMLQLRCISSLLDMRNNQTIIKIKQIVPQ